jgi:hypothetical protein
LEEVVLSYGSLTPEVPLGPFESSPVRVWSAPGKTAKLHAAEHCSRLRAGRVTSCELPLRSVIERMCPQCATYGSWARPGTGLGLFLGALTGPGLLHELASYGEADEDTFTDDEVKQAATLLLRAPHEGQEDLDDKDDDWRAGQEAAQVRTSVFGQWRSAAASLHRAHRLLALFPWLKSWADARMRLKADHVALLQRQAGQLVAREALIAAAGVAAMDTPELPAEEEVIASLGTPTAVAGQLESLWRRWSSEAAGSWEHPREFGYLAHSLIQGMGSRRKGRDAALERAQELVSAWAEAVHAGAAGEQDERELLVRLPEQGLDDPPGRDEPFLARLSEWELGVLACWATAADWERLTLTLRVPETIAARLASGPSELACSTPEQSATEQPVAGQAPAQPVGPGVFDDTPISDRRVVTAEDLRALRTVSREADQLYLVLSVEAGPEVVPQSVLEKRVAGGARCIVIAAASDLPDALVATRREELTAAAEPEADRVWTPRVHESSNPAFGRSLGTDEGERLVVRLARGHQHPDAVLRCLVLARGVADLRDLEGRYDAGGGRPVRLPFPVWDGLLAMEQLDLQPFRPVTDGARRGGFGLPLGVLARVQLYTTDAAGRFEGRAHSPACTHQSRDHGVTRYYDLVTVEQMLRAERFDPCSKCGGYATRRLSMAQVAYYRAAHQVHALAQQVRWVVDHPDLAVDAASLLAELKGWDDTPPHDEWFDAEGGERQWCRFIRRLLLQLEGFVAER